MSSNLSEALDYINGMVKSEAKIGIILGSGLGALVDDITDQVSIPTETIPHFPKSTVIGHAGKIVFGKLNGVSVIALKGRTHLYEGYDVKQVVFIIHILNALGITKMIVTNAAGGANSSFKAGDLMIISDHINFMFRNPLIGKNDDSIGPRFPDMSEPYSDRLIEIATESAIKNEIDIKKGVYCAVTGPSYETAAEVRMFQKLGADAIGMSTVPDVIAARHLGMEILGISCITNPGTGLSTEKLSHDEVTEIANLVAEKFKAMVIDIISNM